MNIIIVGLGKVGYRLAESLAEENNNITVIDIDDEAVNRASQALDVMCIAGNGVSVSTLIEAGIKTSDVLIAVTAHDEVNMVCCLMGKKLGARYTAARIRELYYNEEIRLLKEELELDVVVNPEEAAAREIAKKLQYSSANFIESFGRGGADLVELSVDSNSILKNRSVMDISQKIYSKILICAVLRDKEVFIPNGSSFIKEGDTIYIMGNHTNIMEFYRKCGAYSDKLTKNIMIVGGGKIALYLTDLLKPAGIKAKVIEKDEEASIQFAQMINNGIVINGDGTDEELLVSENIQSADAFVALTGHDEDNLMSALLAQEHGVPKIITKITRPNYTHIVRKLGIRSVISPSAITVTIILKFIRKVSGSDGKYLESLYRILDGRAEVTEYRITNDFPALGIPLMELNILKGVLVAVILRRNDAIIPNGTSVIKEGDKIILITNKPIDADLNAIFGYGAYYEH